MKSLFDRLRFGSGATMSNRFMLAPLTNLQSHADGTLSDDEYRWLTLRAKGGFGATMTCASHVQANGPDPVGRGHSQRRQPGAAAVAPRGNALSGGADRDAATLRLGPCGNRRPWPVQLRGAAVA